MSTTAVEIEADPVAAVAAWRARQTAAVDAVGLAVAEALARRTAEQQGPARALLARRVEQLLAGLSAAPSARMAAPMPTPMATRISAPRHGDPLALLSELVDRLGRVAPVRPMGASAAALPATIGPGGVRANDPARAAGQGAAAPAGLKSMTAFKSTWVRLRAEQRLHQAAAQVPGNAGPLHSSQVIYRALREMQALSPGYLDAFMSHVESLIGLEQAAGLVSFTTAPAAAAPAAPASAAGRARAAGTTPRRRAAGKAPGRSTAA